MRSGKEMTVKLAIIEDEERDSSALQEMMERYRESKPEYHFQVTVFSSALSFLMEYHADYDLIFMDIQMPSMNGMEAARRVRKIDDNVLIVFVTNIAQYAVDGYEVHAYDFILKPVHYGNFSMKFDRILNSLKHRMNDECLTISGRFSTRRLRIADIVYVEVSNHDLIFHLVGTEYSCRGKMSEMEEKLSEYHFIRCNACYLVNLHYVQECYKDYLVADGVELRISQNRRQYFLNEFAKYVGGSV
jgi:DNA-binding LytR/AlgR family response regulator